MPRVFFALSIDEQLADELAIEAQGLQQQLYRAPLKWIPSDNYHITLSFLGDVSGELLPPLCALVDELAARHRRALMALQDIVWFPSIHKPRLLVVGLDTPDAVARLQRDLLQSLRRLGFSPENRRFRPHISLARSGRGLQPQPFELLMPPQALEADELVLFESVLHPGGARYTPLAVALLRAD